MTLAAQIYQRVFKGPRNIVLTWVNPYPLEMLRSMNLGVTWLEADSWESQEHMYGLCLEGGCLQNWLEF